MRWTCGPPAHSPRCCRAVFLWNPDPAAQGPQQANAQGKRDAVDVGRPKGGRLFVGNVEASRQVALYARIAGYVKSVHVGVGDRVKKGQVLAKLSAPEFEADLRAGRTA